MLHYLMIGKSYMSETTAPRCIAPNCEMLAAPSDALCSDHRRKLQKIEDEILTNATRKIRAEMRQFEKLLYVEPPLHSAEIAHRMVWSVAEVRKMLRKFKDDRA